MRTAVGTASPKAAQTFSETGRNELNLAQARERRPCPLPSPGFRHRLWLLRVTWLTQENLSSMAGFLRSWFNSMMMVLFKFQSTWNTPEKYSRTT